MIVNITSGQRFKGLAKYLLTGKKGDQEHRVSWRAVRNSFSDDPDVVVKVMEATASQSLRIQKPVYHVSFNFPPEEQLSSEKAQEIIDGILKKVGLAEHQALYVAHSDTDHSHVHVMINRVHPMTCRAWERSHDRKRFMEELRKVERKYGLRYVENWMTD